uniref:Uncharacterized protein n=1 Tax=Ditylenchus dipsaci TaxID=166011 RepID=A0A915DSQ3_9BILA
MHPIQRPIKWVYCLPGQAQLERNEELNTTERIPIDAISNLIKNALEDRKINKVIALGVGSLMAPEENCEEVELLDYRTAVKQSGIILNVIGCVCSQAKLYWEEPLIDESEEYEALSYLGFSVKGRDELQEFVFDGTEFQDPGTNLYFILGADYKFMDSVIRCLASEGVLHKSLFITGIYDEGKASSKFLRFYFDNAKRTVLPSFNGALDDEFLVQFVNPLQCEMVLHRVPHEIISEILYFIPIFHGKCRKKYPYYKKISLSSRVCFNFMLHRHGQLMRLKSCATFLDRIEELESQVRKLKKSRVKKEDSEEGPSVKRTKKKNIFASSGQSFTKKAIVHPFKPLQNSLNQQHFKQ